MTHWRTYWRSGSSRESVTLLEPKRFLACILYYGFARHLPLSTRPYAFGCRRSRAALAKWLFAHCGQNVNVEHGADFWSGRQISIGDNSGLGVDSLILGPAVIGSNVMMGPRVMLLATAHETSRTDIPMILQGMKDQVIVIEDDVILGAGAIILAGRTVGKGAVVSPGAVVATDVRPYTLVLGNPARVVLARNAGPTDDSSRQRLHPPAPFRIGAIEKLSQDTNRP